MEQQIIAFMKENNFMHNVTSIDYHNEKLKERKWKQLGSELDVNVFKLKRRWKNLEASFHREDRRLSQWTKDPLNELEKWQYYDDLSFLKNNKRRVIRLSNQDKIISFMKTNSFMHNMHMDEYRDAKLKEKKWKELSLYTGQDVYTLKKKWKNIKDAFYRTDRRMNSFDITGAGPMPRWKNYHKLMFLRESKRDFIEFRKNDDDSFGKYMYEEIFESTNAENEYDKVDSDDIYMSSDCSVANDIDETKVLPNKFENVEEENDMVEEKPKPVSPIKHRKTFNSKTAFRLFFESMSSIVDNAALTTEQTLELEDKLLETISDCLNLYKDRPD